MKHLVKAALTASIIGLATVTAHAEFEDADSDKDGKLTMEEYDKDAMKRSQRVFASYDANQDGTIDENEFRAGNFKRYDEDRDGSINKAEYDREGEDNDRFED